MAYTNPNLLPDASALFESGSHGWTAGSNTTLSVVTGKYLEGAQSLQFTATAAGSVLATSPRVSGVTAGAEYVARVPIRRNTTTAGQVATVTITWWSAASGGSNLGTSTATLALTGTAAGWFYYNHPAVVGTAPANAVAATVALSVSGLAAAEIINVDQVYIGAAATHAGNVYGYNTQSMEQDASGWKVDSGTLARGNWNLVSGQGFYALELTTAAAGSQEIRTTSFLAVTPGKEYTSYAAVRGSIATTWYAEFRWYDASSNQVGTAFQSAYSIPANSTQYVGVTATAPQGVGVATCKVFIRPQATAAAQVFVLEDAQFYVASSKNLAGNLLTYAEYSTEGTLPSWTCDGGTVGMTYFSSAATDGLFALVVDPASPGTPARCTLDRLVPVTAGTTYQVRATLFRHNTDPAQSVSSRVRTRIDWYDASGTLYLADNPDQFYASDQSDEWFARLNSETRTAPDGAAYAKVGFEVESDNPLVDLFYVDTVSLIEATADYTLNTSNDTGCITLTVNYVATGSAASNVTVLRMDDDGKASSMRGYGRTWDLAPNPASAIVIEDYEAPLGSRVWYSIQWSDVTGASKGARILTQTVNAPVLDSGDYVWFKSPGVPALNTRVMMEAPLSWSRAARSQKYDIVGRKNPIHVTGTRGGRTSSITVLIWDAESNELFNSLLDAGSVGLIQAMPGYGIDSNLYVSIGDVSVAPLSTDAREEGWRWTLEITEVDRPDGGLQGSAGITWQTILDHYATWEDLFNAYDTWADVLTKG